MKWKVYEYHWMDHYHDNSWLLIDPSKPPKPQVISGVGVLVGKDKDYMYFTEGIQADGISYNGVMAVMRKNIQYLKHIHTIDTSKYKT